MIELGQIIGIGTLVIVLVLAILNLLAWLQDNAEELLFIGVLVFVVTSFVLIFTSPIR